MDRKSLLVKCPENEELADYMLRKWEDMANQKPKGISENVENTLSKAYSNICNSKDPIRTIKDFSQIKSVNNIFSIKLGPLFIYFLFVGKFEFVECYLNSRKFAKKVWFYFVRIWTLRLLDEKKKRRFNWEWALKKFDSFFSQQCFTGTMWWLIVELILDYCCYFSFLYFLFV